MWNSQREIHVNPTTNDGKRMHLKGRIIKKMGIQDPIIQLWSKLCEPNTQDGRTLVFFSSLAHFHQYSSEAIPQYLFHDIIVVVVTNQTQKKQTWKYESLQKVSSTRCFRGFSFSYCQFLPVTPPRCTPADDGARMRSNQGHRLWRSPRSIEACRRRAEWPSSIFWGSELYWSTMSV